MKRWSTVKKYWMIHDYFFQNIPYNRFLTFNHTLCSLEIKAYKTHLIENESYDVSAIRIRAVDEYGNTLYYSSEPIVATAEGVVQVLGPSVTSLKGGFGGIYVKTIGERGKGKLTISSPSFGETTVDFIVEV